MEKQKCCSSCVVLAVEIGVQRPGRRGPALQAVPLAEAGLGRLVLPGAEVQHTGGGVVVFAVVAVAGDLLGQERILRKAALGDYMKFSRYWKALMMHVVTLRYTVSV